SRFQRPENEEEKKGATETLYYVLMTLAKLIAPFMPFLAEEIYQELDGQKESVHLEDWPKYDEKLIDEELLNKMVKAREIVSVALEERAKNKIGVRQVLGSFATTNSVGEDFVKIIKDEINVKEIKMGQKENKLDTNITEELKKEGMLRELTRNVQELRKKSGLTPKDKIELIIETDESGKFFAEKFSAEIKSLTNSSAISYSQVSRGEEVKVDSLSFKIEIKK
ncbi:MAG: isoleucyl-tRNA synthetase, partial [Parcubacteria group bacterium Athens0714_25]